MKKNLSLVMVIIFVITCFSGCTNNKQFDTSAVIEAAKKYELTKAQSLEDALQYANVLSDELKTDGAYYVANAKNAAQNAYDSWNEDSKLPKVNVDEFVFGAVVESELSQKQTEIFGEDVDGYYMNTPSYFVLLVLNNTDDAQKIFEKFKTENGTAKNGEHNGYKYLISSEISGEDDFDEKHVFKTGIYMQGNRILIVSASGLDDGKTGFAYYIFKELGLIDPK